MLLQGYSKLGAMVNFIRIFLVFHLLFVCFFTLCAQTKSESPERTKLAFSYTWQENKPVRVYLQYSPVNMPDYYFTQLKTGVCSDGLCKPINIQIRWDLLGRFLTYHTEERYVLTKFDHVRFTDEDHRQLHKILADTASILRDYKVEDMIDSATYVKSQQIDAVTRPTSPTFENVTVDGALYTVYTLWHFANSSIRKSILGHTKALLSDSLVIIQMLQSARRDYVSFVLKTLETKKIHRFSKYIMNLVGHHDEYIPHFALSYLSDRLLTEPYWQQQLMLNFAEAASSLKNAVLARLKGIPLNNSSINILLLSLEKMSESQINAAFGIIDKNKTQLDDSTKTRLMALSKNSNSTISSHAIRLLQKVD